MNGEAKMESRADPRPHRFLVAGLMFLGMVVAVGGSVGAPLLSMVEVRYHVSLSEAQWMVTLPFLVSAVTTPAMGRLGDGPRRRTTILVGLGVVVCGGLLAAVSTDFGMLLAGRALQGVGLGLLPLAIATARDSLPAHRVGPVVAMLSITAVAGIGLGYPLTGLIAQYGGVHAAYWFALTVAALALATSFVIIPASRHRPPVRVDVAGALMFGGVLTGLILAISEGAQWGWTSPRILGLIGAALVLLAGWIVVELRRSHPLTDLRLLRHAGVVTANAAGLLSAIGMYLLITLVVVLVQTPVEAGYGFGAPVVVAGLMLLPFSAASAAASRLGPALARRTKPATVMVCGAILLVLAMAMFAYAHRSLWEICVVMGAAGLGIGSVYSVVPGLIVRAVPQHETGSAMSFNQVLRYVGYALGGSVSSVILQAETPAGHAVPAGGAYTIAGLAACVIWIAVALAAVMLPRLRFGSAGTDAAGVHGVLESTLHTADSGPGEATAVLQHR